MDDHAVGVGQQHHAARGADLLEHVLHHTTAELQQAGAARPGPRQAAAACRIDCLSAAVVEPEVATALPRAQDQGRELILVGHLVAEEALAGMGEPFLASIPEFGGKLVISRISPRAVCQPHMTTSSV
ncbi:hypothetical protein [Thauera humireducens]|uniref:hypothetical protein n=1 Tax=Thauera humireducens TaxID=1134435 RepID=UPI00311E6C58